MDELLESAAQAASNSKASALAAQRGREISSTSPAGWYAGQVPDSWHNFKSGSAAWYFLRPISMISGSARYTATACGGSFSTATKRKGSTLRSRA